MKTIQTNILAIIAILSIASCGIKSKKRRADYSYVPDRVETYKVIDSIDLKLEVFFPPNDTAKKLRPAIVFFFGGGWIKGKTSQFAPHAEYYAKKGYVTFLVDYRVESKHHTTPFESLMDAKSAVRYIKKNAGEFAIDSSRIIACGSSTGAHLAAATALVTGFNDVNDDTTISSIPETLILFDPVLDTGPNGFGFERIGNQYKRFSPLFNVSKNAPPTILFVGTNDEYVPLQTIENYKYKMDSVGSYCDVKVYEGQQHGFFNYWFPENYEQAIKEVDEFLARIEVASNSI